MVSTTSTSLVYPPAYLLARLARPARGGRQVGKRVVLRVRHLSRFRLGPAGAAAGDAVQEDPVHQGHRDRAQRPLSGGRHHDERDGVRSSARFRADAEDARIHRNGLEGTDLPDGRGPRCRGGGGPRLAGPAVDRPGHRGRIRNHQGGHLRRRLHPGRGRGQRPGSHRASSTSSGWPAMSRPTG